MYSYCNPSSAAVTETSGSILKGTLNCLIVGKLYTLERTAMSLVEFGTTNWREGVDVLSLNIEHC